MPGRIDRDRRVRRRVEDLGRARRVTACGRVTDGSLRPRTAARYMSLFERSNRTRQGDPVPLTSTVLIGGAAGRFELFHFPGAEVAGPEMAFVVDRRPRTSRRASGRMPASAAPAGVYPRIGSPIGRVVEVFCASRPRCCRSRCRCSSALDATVSGKGRPDGAIGPGAREVHRVDLVVALDEDEEPLARLVEVHLGHEPREGAARGAGRTEFVARFGMDVGRHSRGRWSARRRQRRGR